MITTLEQARRVQFARVKRGQKGHSKAVRRFLKRGLDIGNAHNGTYGGKAEDHEKYLAGKVELPYLGNYPFKTEFPLMDFIQNDD